MAMKKQDKPRSKITAFDLVGGIIIQAILQGVRSFNPSDAHLHAGMWQAFEFLDAVVEDERLPFRICPHPVHGDSPKVSDEIYMLQVMHIVYWRPGSGGYVYATMEHSPEHLLDDNPIGRDLLKELTRRFLDEYHLDLKQKTWPEGFDLDRLDPWRNV